MSIQSGEPTPVLICASWDAPVQSPGSVRAACDHCCAAISVSPSGQDFVARRLCMSCSVALLARFPGVGVEALPGDEALLRDVAGADTMPSDVVARLAWLAFGVGTERGES